MSTRNSKWNRTLDDFIKRAETNFIYCLEVDIDKSNLVTARRGLTAATKRRNLPVTIQTDLQINVDIQPMTGPSTRLFMLHEPI